MLPRGGQTHVRIDAPAHRLVASHATMTRKGTPAIVDALEAVVATEQLCARALWMPEIPAHLVGENVFGEKPERLGHDPDDARRALEACEQAAARRDRVAAMLSASALADARRSLARLAEKRRAVVIHVVVSPRGAEPSVSGYADLHAVTDVGVGVIFARDAQDASDLAVIAHRAAEDAEAPLLVVHDGFPASYAREQIVLPDADLLRAALEPAPPALSGVTEDLLPAHRRAATRVPFALASAMRAFDRHSRRKIDAIELAHVGDAELVLLAAGSIGETARALVDHLRASTPSMPIGMLQLTTFRPFPGAQIVKALARVRAVAVIERVDAPLAQSSPLALEVKAAFADALTWAPGYPGIGRIPNVYSGCVEPASSEATPGDLMAIVDNVFQGELGRRVYHLGARHPHEHAIPSAEERPVHPDGAFTVRWSQDPALVLLILGALHGGYTRATPRLVGRSGEAFDVTVSRAPVRAHHGASELDMIVLSGIEEHDLDALDELRDGGCVVIASSDPRALREATPAVRNAMRARLARVLVTPKESTPLGAVASSIAGIERAKPHGSNEQIQTDIERSLRAASPQLAEPDVRQFLDALARALASTVELSSGGLEAS